MDVILAFLYQFNFRYVLRFIIISRIHGTFSLSSNEYVQNIGTQKFLQKKGLDILHTGIVKKLRKFQ